MEWKKFLSERRIGTYGSPKKNSDLRSEFEKDYHRIIGSASFRRLQDKTQVFPLDKSDFIRTRLTHSLEVSSFGRSLAENISQSIIENRLDPAFTLETKENVCEILQCAGLVHDIGNPPFGHFGEEAIRAWFSENLPKLSCRGRKLTDLLDEQELADLYHFEGNAQALRLVSKLHFLVNENGMNLTCGLLSAMIKYPHSSLEIRPDSANIQDRKMGYFKSEQKLFAEVQEETGTNGARSPLAFILEAADDIAYATADIEDAFKKGFFDYDTLLSEIQMRGADAQASEKLTALYERGVHEDVVNPQEYAVMNWLVRMQGFLMYAATDGFISHYRTIMKGGYPHELFYHTAGEKLLAALKGIAYDYAFTSASIYRTEIAAGTILTYILDRLVPAVLSFDEKDAPGLMDEKFISLISENYKQVYRIFSRNLPENEKLYLKILLVTDSVSGMTDSYARDLYRELNGLTE